MAKLSMTEPAVTICPAFEMHTENPKQDTTATLAVFKADQTFINIKDHMKFWGHEQLNMNKNFFIK